VQAINETYDVSNFNHDHASDQEEEEEDPLGNNDTPQANDSPIRQIKQPALLTFDFNSQYRQWTEAHKAYHKEVIES
jgi:hypothetical protein